MLDLRRLFAILLAIVVAAVWLRQRQDEGRVQALAEAAACGETLCAPTVLKRERDLFGWTFQFHVEGASRVRRYSVACGRPFWIFGAYDCRVVESNAAPSRRPGAGE